jgi:HEPN domain-containing protein
MKSDADHLPERNQQELEHIQRILLDEFAAAIATATKPHKRNGKVYKIILFGSYARDDWVDIARDGIALYDLPCHALATPMPLTPTDAFAMAQEYFDHWFESAGRYLDTGISHTSKGWNNEAAFELHQAAERLYICFLLVRTLYFPRSHNIKFLRSLAEDKEPRLIEAWPRASKVDRRRFELLKRAYVEARYSPNYTITADDLDALASSVERLREIVESLCRERLEELRQAAA